MFTDRDPDGTQLIADAYTQGQGPAVRGADGNPLPELGHLFNMLAGAAGSEFRERTQPGWDSDMGIEQSNRLEKQCIH